MGFFSFLLILGILLAFGFWGLLQVFWAIIVMIFWIAAIVIILALTILFLASLFAR